MRAIYADNVLLRITSEKEDNWKSCKGKPNEYDIGVNNGLTLAHAIVLGTPTIEVPRWIPVTERLPEKERDVLCFIGNHIGAMMDVYAYMGDDKWDDTYGYRNCTEEEGITHWMPLPDAPKDGE